MQESGESAWRSRTPAGALRCRSIAFSRMAASSIGLGELIAREDVGEIVVGLPLSLSGEASAQTERAQAFAAKAEERLGLPVHMWDERLSSREAERLTSYGREGGRDSSGRDRGRRGGRSSKASNGPDTDAMAASIILQAFLDSRQFRT